MFLKSVVPSQNLTSELSQTEVLTTKNERWTKAGFLHDLVATTLMDFRAFYEANHSASTLVWTQIKKAGSINERNCHIVSVRFFLSD